MKEFARQFAIPPHLEQTDLVNLIVKYCHSTSSASESPSAVIVAGIALYLRLVLAFDEKEAIAVATDTNTNINTDTSEGAVINNDGLCQACIAALCYNGVDKIETQKAAIALITWTSTDKDLAADPLLTSISDLTIEKSWKKRLTKIELNRLPPREFAAHQKMEYEEQLRRKERSKNNTFFFCDRGGLEALLSCATSSSSSSVDEGHHIREVCIAIGRILSQIDSESNIKRIVSKYVTPTAPDKYGVIIEEIDGEV